MTIKRHSSAGRPKRSEAGQRQIRQIRERLNAWRNERSYTHETLAKQIGIARTTVTGWFSNPPTAPAVEHLVKLAERERLNLNWLLLGVGPSQLDALPEDPLVGLYLIVRGKLKIPRSVPRERLDYMLPTPEVMADEILETYQKLFRRDWVVFLEDYDGVDFEELWPKKKVASVRRFRNRIGEYTNRQAPK